MMSEIRSELRYLSSHEWARVEEDGTVTIGITDYAQNSLGDVVYVECPEVGDSIVAGEQVAVVESVKAASDVYAALSGEVIAVNDLLAETPELVNESPYDDGWFFKIRPNELEELKNALDSQAYEEQLEE
ncbi:MAG: glycine cleavage system H protein [Pseudohongiellaceae bacterium]|jgi:glycine cleavage system H protein